MQKLKKLNFNQNSSCKISFHIKTHIKAVKITPKNMESHHISLKGVEKHKQVLSLHHHDMNQKRLKNTSTKTVITRGLLLLSL